MPPHDVDSRRDLETRWAYLTDGAALAAMLCHAAREGELTDLARAIKALDEEQLECAAFALVLLHVEGAPALDPLPPRDE